MVTPWHPCRIVVGVVLGFAAAPTQSAEAQLIVDHQKRTTIFNRDTVKKGDRVAVRSPYALTVKVKNSNSALFDCALTIEEKTSPDLDAVFTFTKALGPYAIDLATLGLPAATLNSGFKIFSRVNIDTLAKRDTTTRWRDSLLVDSALRVIDRVMLSGVGLRPIYSKTLAVLDSMRGLPLGVPPKFEDYKSFIEPNCVPNTKPACARLTSTGALVRALSLLADRFGPFSVRFEEIKKVLATTPVSKPQLDALQRLADGARDALASSDDLLGLAYATEKVMQRAYNAKTEFDCDEVKFTWNSARDITINVAPSAIPAIARTTTVAPYTTKVMATADWIVRPTVGLSFMAIPKGQFPKYGTKKLDDTTFSIKPSGTTDARYTYGLTLALTWRGLDYRNARVPVAFYLPDFTVNPSADLHAVGLGLGVSVSKAKFGFGRAWTKHSVLANGQGVGTSLKDPEELSTRDAYGSARWYWSVAFVGIPPFLQ